MTKRIKPVIDGYEPVPNNPNSSFCMVPWVHTHITPQGERRVCCTTAQEKAMRSAYGDENDLTSLAEHWNSAFMRDIRKKMMAGEKLEICKNCHGDKANSYQKFFAQQFGHLVDQAFEQTTVDGSTQMPIISYDYRVSNLCNFSCRMCGEEYSSSWEAERERHNIHYSDKPRRTRKRKKMVAEFQKEVVIEEFKQAIRDRQVQDIYWAGGEPLMYDVHWWALEEMIQNGSAKDCNIRYNTNLGRLTFKNKHLYDYLPHFNHWQVGASIDGTGEIVEYIRRGIKWDEWLQNFKGGLALPDGSERMIMDVTVTGPSLFCIVDLVKIAVESDVRIFAKPMLVSDAVGVQTALAWPRPILERVLDEKIAQLESIVTGRQQSIVTVLEEMKKMPTFQESYPDRWEHDMQRGIGFNKKLDQVRNEKLTLEQIYQADAELYEWWMQIVNKGKR